MNRVMSFDASPESEALLAKLITLATRVIDEHIDDHGRCAACGCPFPCEQAVLAEHALAAR